MKPSSSESPSALRKILQRDLEEFMELKRVEIYARRKIINLYHLGAQVELGEWALNLPFDDIDQERPFLIPTETCGSSGAFDLRSVEQSEASETEESAADASERAFYSFRAMRLAINQEDVEWIWSQDRNTTELMKRLRLARMARFDKFREQLTQFAWTIWEDRLEAMRRSKDWSQVPAISRQYCRVRWAVSRMAVFSFGLSLGLNVQFPGRPVSSLLSLAKMPVSVS